MNRTDTWSPKEAWRQFRLEAEAARHYPYSYLLNNQETHRDVLLERLLPTLLYIKGVAILDDSLELWLVDKGHSGYKENLNGRLQYLADKGLLQGTDELHKIRTRRNALAHEPSAACTWEELAEDILLMEVSLVSLDLVRPTEELEYFAERSALQASSEPGIRFFYRITYGVKEGGQPALEISFEKKIHES